MPETFSESFRCVITHVSRIKDNPTAAAVWIAHRLVTDVFTPKRLSHMYTQICLQQPGIESCFDLDDSCEGNAPKDEENAQQICVQPCTAVVQSNLTRGSCMS